MSSENNKRSLTAPRLLLSALIYILLIGVVWYGIRDHVYDGFSKAVPFVIGGVFAVMAVVRVFGFFNSLRAQKAVKKLDSMSEKLDDKELTSDDITIY